MLRLSTLRRLLLAYLGFRFAEFGVWVGLAASAYEAGGVGEATAVMLAQLLPAAAAAGSVGWVIRRLGASGALRAGLVLQACGMAWCAGWLAADAVGAGRLVGYVGAIVAAVAVTSTRPAVACILPCVVADDAALARANGAVGAMDGFGMLLGPAAAGLLLAGPGIGAVFAVMAVLVTVGSVLTARLPAAPPLAADLAGRRSMVDEVRQVMSGSSARVVTGLLALVSLLVGALDLALVVTAVDLLGLDVASAAWLNAAFGLGMVLGGVAFGLLRRNGLAQWVVGGLVAWAVVLLGLCASSSLLAAAAMLAGGGIGAACAEVAGRTLLQRIAGFEQLGVAFSFVESTQMVALATGTLTVGVAVQVLGPRAALVAPAAVLLVVTAAVARSVVRSDRHTAGRLVVQPA